MSQVQGLVEEAV